MSNDPDQRHSCSTIAHFDIAGPHIEMLERFYRDVFGWQIARRGPGYASVTTPEGSANGAIVETAEAGLTIGVVVGDLARSLETAAAAGGSVVMPRTDNGWVVKAQIVDPAGNRVTLIQG